MKNVFKNWKTSLVGVALLLGAIGGAFACALKGGDFWHCLVEAKEQIVFAVGFILAKDFDQTGVSDAELEG